jgi:hypothetical protein
MEQRQLGGALEVIKRGASALGITIQDGGTFRAP